MVVDPELFLRAYKRGTKMSRDLFDNWAVPIWGEGLTGRVPGRSGKGIDGG